MRKGFTLLEVLVAAVVFLIAAVPLARIYFKSVRDVETSEKMTIALNLAEQRVEEVTRILESDYDSDSSVDGFPFDLYWIDTDSDDVDDTPNDLMDPSVLNWSMVDDGSGVYGDSYGERVFLSLARLSPVRVRQLVDTGAAADEITPLVPVCLNPEYPVLDVSVPGSPRCGNISGTSFVQADYGIVEDYGEILDKSAIITYDSSPPSTFNGTQGYFYEDPLSQLYFDDAEYSRAIRTYADFKRVTVIYSLLWSGNSAPYSPPFSGSPPIYDVAHYDLNLSTSYMPYATEDGVPGYLVRVIVYWRSVKKGTMGANMRNVERKVEIVRFVADVDGDPSDPPVLGVVH